METTDLTPLSEFQLSPQEETEVMRLAAVGLMPREIALAMEMEPQRAAAFTMLANVPNSKVASAIITGKANGKAMPQLKLQTAANAGNIEAIKELQKLQRINRFNELVKYMDDDESPC